MIWQLNRQRITPLFDKASRLLDAGECRRLYFHRFMVGGGLGSVAANEYAQLRMAYDDFLPLLESDFRYIGRLEAVFLFGHDDRGSLEGSFTEGPEQYALGLRVLERCGNGFAFPDMLGQRESMFRAFANKSEVVRRILATLRYIEYAPAFVAQASVSGRLSSSF